MQGYNAIVVFNESGDRILMCERRKEPYKGLLNFVGGKIEDGEGSVDAAYRELFEETAITKEDIVLSHLMDISYCLEDFCLEIYVGRLNKPVNVRGDENDLYWISPDNNFFDTSKFAGMGNIGHIMLQTEKFKSELLK